MTAADRAAGYDHRLAISQLEVSLTQVFDRPVQGRHFFEAVNALLPDNDRLPRSLRAALDHLAAEIQKLHEEAALAA